MKKSLTAVLLILLALLFVSCDNDKSEEVIATYERFCETYLMMAPTSALFPQDEDAELKDKAIESNNMKAFLSALNPGKVIEVTTTSPVFTAGHIKNTNTDTKKATLVSSDPVAVFTISYKVDTKEITDEKHSISLSSSMEEGEKADSVSFSLTIDNKTYGSISYSHDGEKFTMATVDGQNVNLRLLNAARLDPTPTVKSNDADTTETVTASGT